MLHPLSTPRVFTASLKRPLAATATLAVAALTLAACGSDSLGGSPSASSQSSAPVTVAKDEAVAALVPKSMVAKGTLEVGTDASYAPNEFFAEDGKTILGLDIDLFTAVASKMGLKAKFSNGPFDGLINGVLSKKYDVGASSFTINNDRKRQALMVSYLTAGTQWATKKGNPDKVDPDKACGLNVGVQKGTVQLDDLNARSKVCVTAGKAKINVIVEPEQTKVTADLISGKVVAMAADSPVTAYAVKQNSGELALLGTVYAAAPYGFVMPKSETGLADAVKAALESMNKDGSYKKILDNWGSAGGALSSFAVNPATSE